LITINHFRADLDGQIDKISLVIFVNRLVAFRVGFFNYFRNLGILGDSIVDVQKEGFSFNCV